MFAFEGYLLCLASAIQLLPILICASVEFVGSNAGYPGGGGISAPCSAGIAWAGRGISKAVA